MIIKFDNWCISAPSPETMMQYDNLSDRIIIDGSIPEDYSSWSLLVRVGGNENTITLAPVDGKLGVILTSDMLSYGNVFYDMQLRGENCDKVKHTNVVTVYIPESLSGHGEWPELPSEFAQAEERLRDIASHPPIPAEDGEHWALWSYELQEYVLSDFPLPEGAGGSFNIHSLTAESEIADADEMPFYDSSARGQRKTTWQNIKAKLKGYFDNLYIKATELQNAINTALAQAKESGEFDGEQGPEGPAGRDGYTPVKGIDYFDGTPGRDGADGQNGITPHIGANGNWYIGDTDTGLPSRGAAGQNGSNGTNGTDGLSAYQIAVAHGYAGTEAQWLASLKGSDGAPGTPGAAGADGHTPVKGTDYWTAADKQGIVNDVLAALPDGDEVSY